jgi:hypothetical protein
MQPNKRPYITGKENEYIFNINAKKVKNILQDYLGG